MASSLVLSLLLFGVFCCNFLPIQADCEEQSAQGPRVCSMYVWSSTTRTSNGVIVESPLYVNWGPLRGVNVTKYELQYSQKSIPQHDFRLQTLGERGNTVTSIKLAQVTKSFDYDFRVRVFANGRFGPWSEKETYLAETGRLGPPRGIRVTRGSSQTKYLVSFTAPLLRGIPIGSYRIFYNDVPEADLTSWNQTEVPAPRGPTAPPAEITVEDPTKIYVFRVQAREKDGRYGNVSGVIAPDDFATATPGKPRNFRAVETTSSSISLAWDHPNNWRVGVGRLTRYVLVYKAISRRGPQYTIFLQSDTTEYLANRLTANTAYRFTLTAEFLGEPVPEGPAIITVQTKA